MTRIQMVGVGVFVAVGLGYVVLHRQQLGLGGVAPAGINDRRDAGPSSSRPAAIEWQRVQRSQEGFEVEMPKVVSQIQIPAFTEAGGTEPLNMILSRPDAETTFAVSWQDDAPVVRVNRRGGDRTREAERTLEMARNGALARTQTRLLSERRDDLQGSPGCTFEARNASGGVMNSRLILAGRRLYMLTASFPSPDARRDRDVTRFFNSFLMTAPPDPTPGTHTD